MNQAELRTLARSVSPTAKTEALRLANEYAGTHANNTATQVVERAREYEGYLSGEVAEVPATSTEELPARVHCDDDDNDFIEVQVYKGSLRPVHVTGRDSEIIWVKPAKARRLANALLNAADAAEAFRSNG